MASGVSDYFEQKVLDHMLRNQAFTPPATVYASLHTASPGDTGASEATGGSYARQAIAWNAAASPGGTMTNNGVSASPLRPASACASPVQSPTTTLLCSPPTRSW